MEQKLYRLLGVNQYRKFVIKVKKKYDQWRGKPDTDNYFLKDYSEEGIVFLKSQLIKNAKIHLVGVLVCLPAVLLVGRPWIQVIALLILLHNLYCVMIQRYNLIRINLLLTKKNKKKNISDTESWLNEKVTAFFLTYRKIRDS